MSASRITFSSAFPPAASRHSVSLDSIVSASMTPSSTKPRSIALVCFANMPAAPPPSSSESASAEVPSLLLLAPKGRGSAFIVPATKRNGGARRARGCPRTTRGDQRLATRAIRSSGASPRREHLESEQWHHRHEAAPERLARKERASASGS